MKKARSTFLEKQFGHSLEEIWEYIENYCLKIMDGREMLTKSAFCTKTEMFDVLFVLA